MQKESFFKIFPELADSELRNITILNSDNPFLPDDQYLFVEYYCCNPDCDCRMVTIKILNEDGDDFATILYGWESIDYYEAWGVPRETAMEMVRPSLCLISEQSRAAGYFLEQFSSMIDEDVEYRERLKRHYRLFRDTLPEKNKLKLSYNKSRIEKKIGRNDLCPCNSGKKYKKCCIHVVST